MRDRAVKADERLAVQTAGEHVDIASAVFHAEAGAAVDEAAPRHVIDHAIDGLPVFEKREGDGTVGEAHGVVVGAIDRIEHPREACGDRDGGIDLSELLAEKLVFWKLFTELAKDVGRNG